MPAPEPLDSFLREVAHKSWEAFRQDPLLYVLSAAILVVLSAVSLGIAAGPLVVGFIAMVRRRLRGQPARLGDLFDGFQRFFASFVAVLAIASAVCIGMMLLVVPGVLVVLFTPFAFHAMAYQGAGPLDAIARSFALVREHFLNVLVLLLLVSVAQSLGGAVIFGALLTVPLSLIALTVAYERLLGSPGQALTEAL